MMCIQRGESRSNPPCVWCYCNFSNKVNKNLDTVSTAGKCNRSFGV